MLFASYMIFLLLAATEAYVLSGHSMVGRHATFVPPKIEYARRGRGHYYTYSSSLSSSVHAEEEEKNSFAYKQEFATAATSSPTKHEHDEIVAADDGKVDLEEILWKAAASVTQESCSLLGVKSVGVDYGVVRTGLAVTVGYDPKPLVILSDLNATQVCEQVVRICEAQQANQIVVGLPLHKNGTEALQTNITRIFAAELAVHVLQTLGPEVPVYMWDERYTSKEAAARAFSRDPNRELYGQLDAEAACIILENYYQDNGMGAERVTVPDELQERYTEVWRQEQMNRERNLQVARDERDARLRWRQEAIERDRLLELEQQSTTSTKKGKKKRKKRRAKRGQWLVPGEVPSS